MVKDPIKIEVYVDGCWLVKGTKNPLETGGWGAVIVEHFPKGTKTEALAGKLPESAFGSRQAEILAVASALAAVEKKRSRASKKCEVIIYTDQFNLVQKAANPIEGECATLCEKVSKIAQDYGVSIRYMQDPKGAAQGKAHERNYLSDAHDLARTMAWKSRLEDQGFVEFPQKGRLAGQEALEYISCGKLPREQKLFSR